MGFPLKQLLKAVGAILAFSLPCKAISSPPAGNYILNSSTVANRQEFNVYKSTITGGLWMPSLTAGQCQTTDSTGKVITIPCGSGAANIAITTGNANGFASIVSSPTSVVNFDSTTFNVNLKGASTAYVTLLNSYLTTSSAPVTYLQLSSAAVTYLQQSSATAVYLQQSSATVTYIQVSTTLAVSHGGTGTSSPGLIAGTNIGSITGIWPNQTINAVSTLVNSTASVTSGHCAEFSSSSNIIDSGAACGTGSGGTFTGINASGYPNLGTSATLQAGAGISMAQAGSTITITGAGGTSSLEVMGNSVRITSPTATLSLLAGSNITLTTASVSGTTAQITISASGGGSGGYALQPATVTIQGNVGVTASTLTVTSTSTLAYVSMSTFMASSGTVNGMFYVHGPTNGNGVIADIAQSGNFSSANSIYGSCSGTGNTSASCTSIYGIATSSISGMSGTGVFGTCNGNGNCYGMSGISNGTGNQNIGGYFSASGASTNIGLSVAAGGVNIQALSASQFVKTDGSKNLISYDLLNATQSWTGNQTFQSSTTFNGNIGISSGILLSGSAGTNGQVLTSGGAGTVPTWTTPTGGSGASTLAVQKNAVNVSSPTVAINFLAPPYTVALVNSSTSQIGLDGSSVTMRGTGWSITVDASTTSIASNAATLATNVASSTSTIWTQLSTVATATTTIASNASTLATNVASSTATIWTQLNSLATSTTSAKTQFNAISTSTGTIWTQFSNVASDTNTIVTNAANTYLTQSSAAATYGQYGSTQSWTGTNTFSSTTIAGPLLMRAGIGGLVGNLTIQNGAINLSNTTSLSNIIGGSFSQTNTGDTTVATPLIGSATCSGNKCQTLIGVEGFATGAIQSTGTAYGIYGFVNATGGTNIGLYGHAVSGATNHALSLDAGDIFLNGSAGSSGQVLQSAGSGSVPTWATLSSASLGSTQTWTGGNTFVSSVTYSSYVYVSTGGTTLFNEYQAGASGTSLTINWNNGNDQLVTLTGNVTFTFTAPSGSNVLSHLNLLLKTGSGGFTATWPAAVKWPSGSAPTITTSASKADFISCLYESSSGDYFCQAAQAFTP